MLSYNRQFWRRVLAGEKATNAFQLTQTYTAAALQGGVARNAAEALQIGIQLVEITDAWIQEVTRDGTKADSSRESDPESPDDGSDAAAGSGPDQL